MAGTGKGKHKKNKGKSYNAQKTDKEKHGLEVNIGQQESNNTIRAKADNESKLEHLLTEKVELLYKKALEKLLDLGYGLNVARRAILMNGSIFGGTHVLSNIFSNALDTIEKGHVTEGKFAVEPIFDDIRELARFSMQTLINMVVQDEPEMCKMDAILYLLQCNSLSGHIPSREPHNSVDEKDLGNDKCTAKIDIGKMLKDNMASSQRLYISTSTSSSTRSELDVPTFLSYPKCSSTCFTTTELSLNAFDDLQNLEFIKYFMDFPDNVRIEELLRTCSEDAKDDLISKLNELTETLVAKVKDRREWAKKTIIQVAKRVNATGLELKKLRSDENETRGLFEQKQDIDGGIIKISEREAEKRNIEDGIVIANQYKDILEDKRQETEAENIFYNLSISESKKSLQESQKREGKEVKHFKDTEKNVFNLRRLIMEEKQKLTEMQQKMKQVNQAQLQIEERVKQEKNAKGDAHAQLLEQKRLNILEKENSKTILACLRYELDMKHRQTNVEQSTLEHKLSQLKAQYTSSALSPPSSSSSSTATALDTQIRKHQISRQCIICKARDVSIVFLPCAHLLICSDCNQEVYEALENQCPCCQAQIEKRVQVYGPNS